MKTKLILASQSPRRRELMAKITPDFEVCVSSADETLPDGTAPEQAVAILSERKAQAVAELPGMQDCAVIGSDTVVALGGQILGKPKDREQAKEMLRALSGNTHTVYTGVTVLSPAGKSTFVSAADVCFYPLTEQEIADYVSTGEADDKAGSYGIQGKGALLVQSIRGDYYTVVGLPVAQLYRVLRELSLL